MLNWNNRKLKEFVCINCNAVFYTKAPVAKLCSTNCRNTHANSYQKVRRKSSIEGTLYSIVYGCINRAKRLGLDCDITPGFITSLLKLQNYKCALSGLQLKTSVVNTKKYSDPDTVSIDRIDPNKGYTKDNVRLITYMANSCKGRWSDKQVKDFCKGVLENSCAR